MFRNQSPLYFICTFLTCCNRSQKSLSVPCPDRNDKELLLGLKDVFCGKTEFSVCRAACLVQSVFWLITSWCLSLLGSISNSNNFISCPRRTIVRCSAESHRSTEYLCLCLICTDIASVRSNVFKYSLLITDSHSVIRRVCVCVCVFYLHRGSDIVITLHGWLRSDTYNVVCMYVCTLCMCVCVCVIHSLKKTVISLFHPAVNRYHAIIWLLKLNTKRKYW